MGEKCRRTACPDWYDGIEEDDCLTCCEGRDIEVVSEYASTCDGCGELTHTFDLAMNPETQLSYCPKCVADAGLPGKYDPNSPWA